MTVLNGERHSAIWQSTLLNVTAVNFATTSWSLVLRAAATDSEGGRAAFAGLCEAYWYPLYAFVRRRGLSHEDAADLTQAFFVHMMEKHALRGVDPTYGRFRTFLLASFKNFRSDLGDRARAKKRGGDRVRVPFDVLENRYQSSVTDHDDPERLFERQWALTLLDRARGRLKEEYAATGRADEFATFSPYLVGTHGDVPYGRLSRQMRTTDGAVRVALHRFRRRFGLALRVEIATTVDAPEDIDAELHFLLSTLTAESENPAKS
jgi:RNA polymerase sigma factor (sigma-70 family)